MAVFRLAAVLFVRLDKQGDKGGVSWQNVVCHGAKFKAPSIGKSGFMATLCEKLKHMFM